MLTITEVLMSLKPDEKVVFSVNSDDRFMSVEVIKQPHGQRCRSHGVAISDLVLRSKRDSDPLVALETERLIKRARSC
jgi:hypothetical protein